MPDDPVPLTREQLRAAAAEQRTDAHASRLRDEFGEGFHLFDPYPRRDSAAGPGQDHGKER